MSDPDGANLDAGTFDLDAWIDGIQRPEVTVELDPKAHDFAQRVAEIEAAIPAAEKVPAEERGLSDASPEQLYAQLDELKRERAGRVLRVRLRQLTDEEIVGVIARAKKARGNAQEWVLAAHTVAPEYDGPLDAEDVPQHFTPEQIHRLARRGRNGAAMIQQLTAAANTLLAEGAGLPVPSSPGR